MLRTTNMRLVVRLLKQELWRHEIIPYQFTIVSSKDDQGQISARYLALFLGCFRAAYALTQETFEKDPDILAPLSDDLDSLERIAKKITGLAPVPWDKWFNIDLGADGSITQLFRASG
jgi:hypothetical protein